MGSELPNGGSSEKGEQDHGYWDERRPLLGTAETSTFPTSDESTVFKLFKTVVLVVTWIFIGIFSAIISATIIDLVEISHSNFAKFGEAMIGLNLGMPVGSILAAFLCGRYPHKLDLLLCIFLANLGLSTAVLPWFSSIGLMAVAMTVEGLSRGVITCCGNVMIMWMWMENSPAPLHAMHFGTGFGSFLAPLIAGPFLSPPANNTWNGNTSSNHDASHAVGGEYIQSDGNFASPVDTSSHIYIPYGIEGGYGLVCAIFFLGFYLRRQARKTERLQADIQNQKVLHSVEKPVPVAIALSPGSCAQGHVAFGLQMSVILFFCSACIIGLITSYSTYIMPLAMAGNPHLSKDDATYLASAFWGCFAAGRLASAFLAKWTPIQVLIITEITASFGTSAALAFCGLNSSRSLWTLTCVFAFVSAPLFPSMIVWSDLYLNINGPLMAVLQSGVGVGAILSSWLGGYGFQHYGANFPLYLNFAWAVFLVVLFVIVQIRASLHGRKVAVTSSQTVDANVRPDVSRINS